MKHGTMEQIRKEYRVPAKRGMTVRWAGIAHIPADDTRRGIITGHWQKYICVKFDSSKHSRQCHPLDLDYLVNGAWISGQMLLKQRNEKIDLWNQWLSHEIDTPVATERWRELTAAHAAELSR